MTEIQVRDHGQTRTLTGRTVETIIRREYGRTATVWGSQIVGAKAGGAYPVLATVVSIDGTYT